MPVEIYLIVPDGLRGIFSIVLDPKDGTKMFPFSDGRYELKIPADEPLHIHDDKPFLGYHRIYARYADGTAIPHANTPNMFPAGTIALYGPYIEEEGSERNYWFYIGTEEEVTVFQKAIKAKKEKEKQQQQQQ